MSTETQATPEKLTDDFITKMINETGCSVRFLNEAKPIILKLFRDTSGTALENCLESLRETIEGQAGIEKSSMKRVEIQSTGMVGNLAATPA
ncbi:MAG: hypothetical protein JXR25_08885 [Pontiellaceae bacterium]|nr:hypothetical protein [Pontiellaceae bacterium]MBN2784930.1 hypothetical protein [Pontiellaceae bacterium]